MMVDILMVCLALGCGSSKTKVVATPAEPSAQMRAPTNNIFLNALAGTIGTNIDQLEHRVRVDSNAIGPNSSFFWNKF